VTNFYAYAGGRFNFLCMLSDELFLGGVFVKTVLVKVVFLREKIDGAPFLLLISHKNRASAQLFVFLFLIRTVLILVVVVVFILFLLLITFDDWTCQFHRLGRW
jgi:hypothetical protein